MKNISAKIPLIFLFVNQIFIPSAHAYIFNKVTEISLTVTTFQIYCPFMTKI